MKAPTKRNIIGIALGLAVPLYIVYIVGSFLFEPTDPPRCEEVRIVGMQAQYKSEKFTVESDSTPIRRWNVGRFNTPFPADYIGPAGLLLSRGRWTGKDHATLIMLCPSAVERHIQGG